MKKPLNLLLILIFLSLGQYTSAQTLPPIPDSFYPIETVNGILSEESCDMIRIYPAVDVDGKTLSTMMIGADAKGVDVYKNVAKSKYQLFEGIASGKANIDPLNETNARIACALFSATRASFVVDIKKDKIPACTGECSGYLISPTSGGSNGNFSITTAKINSNNEIVAIGTELAGDPCPTFCGDSNYKYLCDPR